MTVSIDGAGFYDDPLAVDAYLTHRHQQVASPNLVMENPAFLDELGDVEGLAILELGCGDGTFAAECVAAGCASFQGVDGSAEMIERARSAAPSAAFDLGRMEDLRTADATYDLVVARMALHYVVDLPSLLIEMRRALRPGGRLIFSVVHPVVTAAESVADGPRTSVTVDDYFKAGDRTRSWFGSEVVWQHRTIESYVAAVLAAGFELTSLRECEPAEALFDGDVAEYERRRRAPLFLLIAAVAASRPG